MEDTKESIKAKSKAVTSPIKASRQTFPAQHSTNDGQKPVTSTGAEYQKEAELMKDALAIAKDLMNMWPCPMPNGQMPKPFISNKYGVLTIALPLAGHVIENLVTSDGKHDFGVDGEPIIPVTSVSEE